MSLRLLAYAGVMAVFFHLFVTGYEERTLGRRFGGTYLEYRRAVPRWIPRPPRRTQHRPTPALPPPVPGNHGSDGRRTGS